MTTKAGVLVLWRRHISHIVKMHYFFKNLFLYPGTRFRQTSCIAIMTNEGSSKSYSETTIFPLLLSLLLGIEQTNKYIILVTKKKWSSKTVNFMIPLGRSSCVRLLGGGGQERDGLNYV